MKMEEIDNWSCAQCAMESVIQPCEACWINEALIRSGVRDNGRD